MNKCFRAFVSEQRLYGSVAEVNHRLHALYSLVEEKIFTEDESDKCILYPLLASGATSMKKKLLSYAQNQLPGGKYWDPDENVKAILKSLKPNNDICESILGLNDYLSTALPNMHQMSRSNLVQAKKNKTVHWLHTLPSEQQNSIVELARKSRLQVKKDCEKADLERSKLRQEKMKKEKSRRDALEKRAAKEKERLSQLHIITSADELAAIMLEIEKESISDSKKNQKKLAVIREQVNIRKKVLGQKINVPFSNKGKRRPLADIMEQFSTHLLPCSASTCTSSPVHSSESLVGRRVSHKFEVDEEEKWFTGYVLSYNAGTNQHEITYEEDEEHFFFNLFEDISNGDLIVLSD